MSAADDYRAAVKELRYAISTPDTQAAECRLDDAVRALMVEGIRKTLKYHWAPDVTVEAIAAELLPKE